MGQAENEKGVTLIELLIVVAILGLSIVVIETTYLRWSARYKAENALKTLQAYLMDARARAMTRSRFHFLSISGSQYRIFEDSSPAPEGNGALDGSDVQLFRDTVVPLTIEIRRNAVADNVIAFRRDGTADAEGDVYIRLRPGAGGADADYDCIEITPTRLKPGKMNGATCIPR